MPSQAVDPSLHEIVYKTTFNRQWDEYWACRPQVIQPTNGEKLAMLKRCIPVPPDEVGFPTWEDRLAFRHPDMDGHLLFAVLEGVTSWKPNGQLVFLGMTSWRTGRRRTPNDRPPKYEPPGDGWTDDGKRRFAERRAEECRLWLEANGPKHPSYPDVRRANDEYLALADQFWGHGGQDVTAELEELRAEVKRLRTGR